MQLDAPNAARCAEERSFSASKAVKSTRGAFPRATSPMTSRAAQRSASSPFWVSATAIERPGTRSLPGAIGVLAGLEEACRGRRRPDMEQALDACRSRRKPETARRMFDSEIARG